MPNTREKLIELIDDVQQNGISYERNFQGWTNPYCDLTNTELADHLIANGVTVQGDKDINVPTKWISVKDRLPEEKELVLIRCKNGAMFVGYCGMQYCDHERRWRIKTALNSTKLLNLGRVTHWMPLPQPPKGE